VFINKTLDLAGVVKLIPGRIGACPPSECRSSQFWAGFDCFEEFDVLFFFNDIRDCLVSNFFPKPDGLTDDLLVVHLRGGDEARLRPIHNQYYGQPPCYYFLSVIQQFKATLLLTDGISPSDGRWNPCHKLIIEAGAKTTEGDVREDFERLIWARNLVLSVSTFSFAALWLSPIRKKFWTFDNYFQIANVDLMHPKGCFKYFGDHQNCVSSKSYARDVLQEWGATDAQFDRLVRDNCTWTDVKGINRENWPFDQIKRVL
jgi:hypothetical protein